MAKRKEKNLNMKKQEAKTFHDLCVVIAADHKGGIRIMHSLLKPRGISKGDRRYYEESISRHESQLRALEIRRQRYEQYQANKKIPAALRKKIAELETEILRREPGYDVFERGCIRCRKDDLSKLFEQVEQITNPPKPITSNNKAFRMRKDYPSQSITRAYDGNVWDVLKGHFERLPRTKGQRTRFRIVATLPEKAEYLQLKEHHFTRTLEVLVDEAYGVVDELQGELQDAYDNMPDGLQDGPVGEARIEAASQLEDISSDQPDVPPCISALRIVHYPRVRQNSRGDRSSEAAEMLRAVAKTVQTYRESQPKMKKPEAKALDNFKEQLEDHASELDDIEFPGMFG